MPTVCGPGWSGTGNQANGSDIAYLQFRFTKEESKVVSDHRQFI
jgi:hypothetical protein